MERRVERVAAEPGDVGQRADKVLAAKFADLSRSRLKVAFDNGAVSVEGTPVAPRHKIRPGDVFEIVLDPPEVEGAPPAPQAIPLNIVYEDASLVVVNKTAGMVTHPGNGTGDDTLVHALLHHCGGAISSVGGPLRPGIVHRLDRETSGLIVVAKTDAAHHALADAFAKRRLHKAYRALVARAPRLASGSIHEPIARHPTVRVKMAVQAKGRAAHTDWRVIERHGGGTSALLECVIHTGRTHQIRVHLSHLGHPILGDSVYGFRSAQCPLPVPRVMLHAARLELAHPETGAALKFEAPVPADFAGLLAALRDG